MCKALQSSSCSFKVGHGNLQTMSTDKWATSKVYTTFNKRSNCSLYTILLMPYFLTYKADNFTYYLKSDAHYSHIILNKNVVPIIFWK